MECNWDLLDVVVILGVIYVANDGDFDNNFASFGCVGINLVAPIQVTASLLDADINII